VKEPKLKITIDEAVKRVKALRKDNVPKSIPKQPTNDDGNEQIPGVYSQEHLADAGFPGWISGTGYGRELW
jgi:hypothetical protein